MEFILIVLMMIWGLLFLVLAVLTIDIYYINKSIHNNDIIRKKCVTLLELGCIETYAIVNVDMLPIFKSGDYVIC